MNHSSQNVNLHPSVVAVLNDLRERYPQTPFLALGQTALWDEPVKATLRRALDHLWPDARMVAGAHDTDYFAKFPGHPARSASGSAFALVPHDDGRTRGLWSAAGEMSQLFGSEDVPTQHALAHRGGVSLHRALGGADDPAALLSELTTAWGWRGIVEIGSGKRVAGDIPLGEILPTLLKQIEWATGDSANCIGGVDPAAQENAALVGATLHHWVDLFARNHPDATLADLYRDLFPRIYEMLLAAPPANLSTTTTTRLLRFNKETCGLPRFALVDLFLRPNTRRAAEEAYNLAVAGSDIYTLDRFGGGDDEEEEGDGKSNGALPFDLVIPGQGRGTLFVRPDGGVFVDTPRPTLLWPNRPVTNIQQLAALVEQKWGPDVVLVGKAVTLLPLLCAEFLLTFHEGASGYSDRTREMVAQMARRGLTLPDLRPIVRVRYSTWDALAALPDDAVTFHLPEHLAQAFGCSRATAEEFAACWRCAVQHEEDRLRDLATIHSPRALLRHLAQSNPQWQKRVEAHDAARMRLLTVWERAKSIQGRIYTLYDQANRLTEEANRLERDKGDHFRQVLQPLLQQKQDETNETLQSQIARLQAERVLTFDAEIAARRGQVRFARETIREMNIKRLALEQGEEATEARRVMHQLEAEAECERARLVRNALQVVQSLPHTDFRPSAWWFPLVDPSGRWFNRLVETTTLYLEPLQP